MVGVDQPLCVGTIDTLQLSWISSPTTSSTPAARTLSTLSVLKIVASLLITCDSDASRMVIKKAKLNP